MEAPTSTAYLVRYEPGDHRRLRFRRGIFGLALTMVVLAVIIIVCGILVLALGTSYGVGIDALPIWGGILLLVTGSFGVAVAKRYNSCLLIAFLVLSIISTLMATAVLGMGITWSIVVVHQPPYGYYHDGSNENPQYRAWLAVSVFEALIAIMGFIYLIVAIVASSLSCGNLCGCCCPKNIRGGQVVEIRGQFDQQPPGYEEVTVLPQKT